MAYNGSGVFNRLYSWVTDRNNGIPIDSTRMDAEFDDIASALSSTITKDGQTTITANLPMAGYRHTGVGNASAIDQYASGDDARKGAFNYSATVGGTADAITLSPSFAASSYAAGQVFRFIVATTNTGAVTVNVSGLGAKDVKLQGGSALAAGDLTAGSVAEIFYDGTDFELLTSIAPYQIHADTVGGTADAITLTPDIALPAYREGQLYSFIVATTNTTAVTVNVSGLGVKAIKREGGRALVAGDLIANSVAEIRYDGTDFELVSAAPPFVPTIQKFTSGSGTYTTPDYVRYIRVRMVGGGAGGAGSGGGAGNGSNGGDSTFGTSLLTASGGTGGGANDPLGGAGGSASLGAAIGTALAGGYGDSGTTHATADYPKGGRGGDSIFNGGGSGSGGSSATAGGNAVTNTGGGGGGAGSSSTSATFGGAGGGAGGFVDAVIISPSATYSYAVGSGGGGGTAGANGFAGGSGAAGYIEVTEYYS